MTRVVLYPRRQKRPKNAKKSGFCVKNVRESKINQKLYFSRVRFSCFLVIVCEDWKASVVATGVDERLDRLAQGDFLCVTTYREFAIVFVIQPCVYAWTVQEKPGKFHCMNRPRERTRLFKARLLP